MLVYDKSLPPAGPASSLYERHNVAVGGVDVWEEGGAGGGGGGGEGLEALCVAGQARQQLSQVELGVRRQRVHQARAQPVEQLHLHTHTPQG